MGANPNFSRVDTLELKDHIYRSIGHQRAVKYFDHLNRFFAMKLSKTDFNKVCIQTIGRENISLHNRLIRAILQNASQAKTPPQKPQKVDNGIKVGNDCQKSCLQSLYGDKLPQSPRKCRSPINRKFRDRPSPLGPFGKSPSIITCEETSMRLQEQQSATELHSLCSKPPVEDGEEVEQFSWNPSVCNWSSITPLLGVSFNNSVAKKVNRNSSVDSCQTSGELPDTVSLMSRLQKKLAFEGFDVSMDCANLLNNGLDSYMKRLIGPCLDVAGSSRKSNNQFVSGLGQMVPGVFAQRQMQPTNASMLDFRVAMETNPCILGQDWPKQFKKICHYASE